MGVDALFDLPGVVSPIRYRLYMLEPISAKDDVKLGIEHICLPWMGVAVSH